MPSFGHYSLGLLPMFKKIAFAALGLSLLASPFIASAQVTTGYNWTNQTSAGVGGWDAVAMSADGSRLIGSERGTANQIVISTDGGATWQKGIALPEVTGGYQIAASSDGMKLLFGGGDLDTSTDGGLTWTKHTPVTTGTNSPVWQSVAISADGSKMLAADIEGDLWRSTDGGNTWTKLSTGAPTTACGWRGVGSSSDGSRLVAAKCNGYIYTSSDGGATWTAHTGPGTGQWTSAASSADGMTLAVANPGSLKVWVSSDGGTTWKAALSGAIGGVNRAWSYVSMSSDGTHMVAAAVGSGATIYTSSDRGVTWTPQMAGSNNGNRQWTSVAMSADGSKIIAGEVFNNLFTAGPGTLNDVAAAAATGAAWTTHPVSGERGFMSVTSSADGTKLATVSTDHDIYTSTDSGATWTERTSAPVTTGGTLGSYNFLSIASSADGTKLAAVQYGGYIYTSSNGGATWTQQTAAGDRQWYQNGITMSADGTKLAAFDIGPTTTGTNGYIYISKDGRHHMDCRSESSCRWRIFLLHHFVC